MRSHYQALGFVIVLAFAALALWFVFVERMHPGASGPQPADVPPGTTPRQVTPGSTAPPS